MHTFSTLSSTLRTSPPTAWKNFTTLNRYEAFLSDDLIALEKAIISYVFRHTNLRLNIQDKDLQELNCAAYTHGLKIIHFESYAKTLINRVLQGTYFFNTLPIQHLTLHRIIPRLSNNILCLSEYIDMFLKKVDKEEVKVLCEAIQLKLVQFRSDVIEFLDANRISETEQKTLPIPTLNCEPTKIEIFEAICRTAEAEDKNALTALLASIKENINIRIKYDNKLYTPAAYLAFSKKHQAVDFLIQYFSVGLDEPVLGYAEAGESSHVENLLQRGASHYCAIKGYARSNNDFALKKLPIVNIYAVLEGCVGANNSNAINTILSRGYAADAAIVGYAQANLVNEVNLLLTKGGSKKSALLGYAYGDLPNEIHKLNSDDKHDDMSAALVGYAQANLTDRVNHLLSLEHERGYAARGYGYANLPHEIEKLLEDEYIGDATHAQVIDEATKGYMQDSNGRSAARDLRFLSLFHHKRVREVIATSLNQTALLPRAGAIAEYMAAMHFSYEQASAWTLPETYWLLMYADTQEEISTFPLELLSIIINYLSHASCKELEELVTYSQYEKKKNHFVSTLNEYSTQNGYPLFFRNKTKELASICDKTITEQDFLTTVIYAESIAESNISLSGEIDSIDQEKIKNEFTHAELENYKKLISVNRIS